MTGRPELSPLILNRLSVYLRCLRQLQALGTRTISSQELAERFQLSAPQIRRDLATLGELGIRGVGYEVDELARRIRSLLGLDREHRLIVVGAGRLGSALAGFLTDGEGGFRVVAAVDNDRAKVGQRIAGLTVRHASELSRVVARAGAEIAVLAVPAAAAQENYDALVAAGIAAVLNFAPVQLTTVPEVPAKTVDLRVHLEELAFLAGVARRAPAAQEDGASGAA